MKNRFLKKTIAAAVVSGLFTLSQTALAAEDAFVAQAKQTVAAATSPQTVWDGPTTGPKLQKGKSVIFIASDMKNGGVLGVLDGMKEAAAVAGWKLDVLDGAGSVNNQLASLNQAIAKKPDAIVIGGWNPNVARNPLKKANEQNITLIAWHATRNRVRLNNITFFITSPPTLMKSPVYPRCLPSPNRKARHKW